VIEAGPHDQERMPEAVFRLRHLSFLEPCNRIKASEPIFWAQGAKHFEVKGTDPQWLDS
jgi:hypothetical protein